MIIAFVPLLIYIGLFYGQCTSIILARKLPLNYILFILSSIAYSIFFAYIGSNVSKKNVNIFLWGQISNAVCILGYSFIARRIFSLGMACFGIATNLMLFSFVLCIAYPKKIIMILCFYFLNLIFGCLNAFNLNNMIVNYDYELLPEDYIMGSCRMSLDFFISIFKKKKKYKCRRNQR